MLNSQGFGGLLNMQTRISGSWEYEEQTQILTLNMTASGLGRSAQEAIQIRMTGREQGEITGQDFAGRNFVIQRRASTRDTRAGLVEVREAFAGFVASDLDSDNLEEEIGKLMPAIELYEEILRASGPPPREGAASLAGGFRALYVGKQSRQLAAGAVIAQGLAMTVLKKIDERLQSLH
jgi:hypothetical protein